MNTKINTYILLFIALNFLCFCSSSTEHKQSISDIEDNDSIEKDTIEVPIKSSQYEQIVIPLDNKIGVPFFYHEKLYGYIIEGFEVDNDEHLYFLGGEKSMIACFDNGNEIFRKEYSEFLPNELHIYGSQLYVFDYKLAKNNLFQLETEQGQIIDSFPQITVNSVNNYYFVDSTLITKVFNKQERIDMNTETAYIKFNLKGELSGYTDNRYDLLEEQKPKGDEKFMGYWNNKLVFVKFVYNENKYEFRLKSLNNETIKIKSEDLSFFGKPLFGLEGYPEEHRKLRNNKIYVLGRKDENAVITILPLEKLFAE